MSTYKLGNDSGNAGRSSQGESALLHNLGVTLLIRVLHGDNNLGLGRVADEIHGTAETLDLAGKHPVGQVTIGADLHGTQNGEVNATSADHAETLLAAEDSSSGQEGDSLLTGVYHISVLRALLGVRAQTENTVLRLQLDFNLGANKAGGKHGHSDTQVGVHAILELLGRTTHDTLTLSCRLAASEGSLGVGVVLVLGECVFLNVLLAGALDDVGDVDSGQVDSLGGNLTGLYDVLGLDNGDLGVAAHGAVEVVGREPELAVAQLVGLVRLDERVVAGDGLLHDIALAVEHFDVLGVAEFSGRAVGLVSHRDVARLHHSTVGSWGVECGDALASGGATLSERALGGQFQFNLTSEVHALKGLVLANVASNHLLDLLRLEQLAEARVVGAGIVGDGGKALDFGLLEDFVNERVGDTAEAETAAEECGVGLHVLDGLAG